MTMPVHLDIEHEDGAAEMTLGVARGEVGKLEIAMFLRAHTA